LERHGNKLWRNMALRLFAKAFRGVDRIAWKRYQRVFAISEEVRRRILQGRLYPEDKIQVIHPGVDFDSFKPGAQREKNFLIPGRIMWTKNIELGIAAFRLLLGRRSDLADFRLTISGFVDRKSRPYLAQLRRQAESCPQIRLIESPSDAEHMSLYQSAYAIVYPPFNEDWGLVPLEAMALGKPVIALNRGGPRETVLHEETGLLVEPTPTAFAAAMERLADDPALAQGMGERGRARAAGFNWKHFCAALDDSLDEIVARTRRA
jgi:glycosyltransferase involved in cell wall biosynthesis